MGWIPGGPAAAEYANFLAFWTYEWIRYLDEGNLDVDEIYHGDRTPVAPRSANADSSTSTVYQAAELEMYVEATGGSGLASYPLPLRGGDRVKSITVEVYGNGIASGAMTLRKRVNTTFTTTGSSVSLGVPSAAWTTKTITIGSGGYVQLANETLYLDVELGGTGWRSAHAYVTYDRPRP